MLGSDLGTFIANFVIQLIYLLILSAINQIVINQLKQLVPDSKIKGTNDINKKLRNNIILLISMGIAILETINLKLDLTYMFNNRIDIWGQIITGLVLSSGTVGIHKLLGSIKDIKEKSIQKEDMNNG